MCIGSNDKEGCVKVLCKDCDENKGYTFTLCDGDCNGEWCVDCAPADVRTCAGSGKKVECLETLRCASNATGVRDTRSPLCDGGCGGFWCTKCLPASTLSCTGSNDAEGCRTLICVDCNDGGKGGTHITTCPVCGATRYDDCVANLDGLLYRIRSTTV